MKQSQGRWQIMSKRNLGEKIKLASYDDMFGMDETTISPVDQKIEGQIIDIQLDELHTFENHSIINSDWDLIIVDEAHRMAGSSGEVARYKLGQMLSEASPYLLLLTATPHNGKTEPFLRLIRLLDAKAFPNMEAIVKEQVAPYVIRTEKRETIDNYGEKLFKERHTHLVELYWEEKHSGQRELYEKVTEYVSKNYNKAMRSRGKNMWIVFLLVMMQRLVSSSTAAITESVQKRMTILANQDMQFHSMSQEEFAEMDLEDNQEEAIEAISLDIKSELKDLEEIIAVAKQAGYQHQDVKLEPLINILEDLYQTQNVKKIIIFTEFVATQQYLKEKLEKEHYAVTILNGSMSMEERNLVIQEFQEKTDLLISTDAGGEGLNLQFSNCVINYDLPWNPMKIEQRIGRVDRIGQEKDVEIYNFILADTVENRVRNVLEDKLSVILKEIGVDKYSDVLDGETSELNYTEAYMKTLRDPKYMKVYTAPIEEDLKQQVKQSLRIKDLISEDKNLEDMLGKENHFDMEKALRQMLSYYAFYINDPMLFFKDYSIYNPEIQEHLKKVFLQDMQAIPMKVFIENFPNEKGFFMLWNLKISEKTHGEKIIPVFINENAILRPLAGQRIWDVLCDESKSIEVEKGIRIEQENIDELLEMSRNYIYDEFLEMKGIQEANNEEIYHKYSYAIKLRMDAANRIGIENIKKHKLSHLEQELKNTEIDYQQGKKVCPELEMILLLEME